MEHFLDGRFNFPEACYTFKICDPVGNIDRTHQQLFGFGEWWLCAWIFSTWSVPVRAMHSSLVPLYLQRVEEHLLILWSCQSDSQNFQDNTGRSTRLCRSFIRSLQGLEAHLWLANWHPTQAGTCLSSIFCGWTLQFCFPKQRYVKLFFGNSFQPGKPRVLLISFIRWRSLYLHQRKMRLDLAVPLYHSSWLCMLSNTKLTWRWGCEK